MNAEMTDLVILVPVLRRPHRVQPLLDSIRATCDARVLFLCSTGDDRQIDAVDATGEEAIVINHHPGDYARKANIGYLMSAEPLLMLGADDLHFHAGWYEAAVAALSDTAHVVGLNDLCNPRVMSGEHATHYLIRRSYVDEHGTIDDQAKVFHEGYRHNFVDDEFLATARLREAFAMALDSHVEHLHPTRPANTPGTLQRKLPQDRTYSLGIAGFEDDRAHYNSRRHLWGQEDAR